ncbi:MAG: hypothetical protein IT422_04630 [Pirellulaceae bacterium]|nr:hypothetical protein [Pirellulaceae bacterium]
MLLNDNLLNLKRVKIPRAGWLAACLMLTCAFTTQGVGQDYVGVLPEMLKPEVSQKLGLSEEQRESIQQLIRARMSAVIGLGQALREAPADTHDQLRSEFNAESERLGFALLDSEQQNLLAKYRVGWMGMLSLGDEQVATALNLADWQHEVVDHWLEQVRNNRRGPTVAKTRSAAEQSIRQALSESQWAAWQLAAGLIETSTAGPPTPPQRPDADQLAQPDEAATADQPATESQVDNSELPVDQVQLEMNFQAQPWNDVVQWLAKQGDLSLQNDTALPGTFTYRDRSRKYSVTEAMDIMNASLLNAGYTLLRQGRMLRVIDFETDQEKSGELLNELADYVDEDELARRGYYEPVKHMFTLERLDPDTLKEEAEQLRSIQGSVRSFPTSRQLLVTDMAGNVRAIAEMIRRAEDSGASTVKIFPLKAITAEEILSVVRPLIGLEEDANSNDDISISTNTFGTTIFARGKPDKVQILKDLIDLMDVPPDESESTIDKVERLVLQKHKVVGIDMQLAYEIVSQLLAGSPDVKLAQDAVAKQLVLQARPSEHKLVQEALGELAGDTSDFVVIQLKRLDPTMAIAAIKKFFALPDTPTAESGGPVIDGDLLARQVWIKGSSSQVSQIQQLLEKLEENANSNDLLGDTIRMIPLTGSSARQTLEQVEKLWKAHNGGANPIRVIAPSTSSTSNLLQQKTFSRSPNEARRVRPSPPGHQPSETSQTLESGKAEAAAKQSTAPVESTAPQTRIAPRSIVPTGRLVAFPQQEASASDELVQGDGDDESDTSDGGASGHIPNAEDESGTSDGGASGHSPFPVPGDDAPASDSEIIIMQGPGGLIIQSEDKQALAEFDSLLRLLVDQAALGDSEPTIVYLKHRHAEAAKELLETILSGSSSSSGSSGGLLGDMAGAVLGGFGGGMFGSMLGGSGGSSVSSSSGIASGDYTITADPWLNALVIKASPSDMQLIEQLLHVIDQAEGPLSIETQGQLAMIPVISQDVNQMLNMIKQLYGDRIEGNSSGGGGGGRGGGGGGQPNPAEIIAALRGGGGGGRGGGAQSKLVEPKISIGADTNTNSLIVRAQPNQIEELRRLVEDIDEVGEAEKEDFAYSSLDGVVSATLFKDSITRILGPKAVTNISSTATPSNNATQPTQTAAAPGGSDDAATQARRAAFAEMMRSRFGGGRGGDSGGDGGGRGGRGGGGRGGN